MDFEREDQYIQDFRETLNKWKRDTLFAGLSEETDTNSTDRRIAEAHELYYILLDTLRKQELINKKLQQGGGDEIVNTLLEKLGPREKWTESLLDRVRHIIMTDLYEYPLTFNITLIEQFKKEPNFPVF